MICNELYNGQGLGNQLWNYVTLRIIADTNNYKFTVLGSEKFKGIDFMTIDFGQKVQGGISPEGGPALFLPTGINHYYRERKEVHRARGVDISRSDPYLLSLPDRTKFDGNCQSTKYLVGYEKKIKNWLSIKRDFLPTELGENTCIIHLRIGDYADLHDVFLPVDYYKNAIAYLKTQDPDIAFAIVTDEPEKAKLLLPDIEIIGASTLLQEDVHKALHHRGGPIGTDFCLLLHASYLIIPNSSFSWWAAYLNTNKKIVVAPKYWAQHNTSDGYWSTADIVTDGFTYLDRNGKVSSASACWQEKEMYENAHPDIFFEVSQKNHISIFEYIHKKCYERLTRFREQIRRIKTRAS